MKKAKQAKNQADGSPHKPEYTPTERESEAIRKFLDHNKGATPRIKILKEGNKQSISLHHPDPAIGNALLLEALGTNDLDFVNGLLLQLANASSKGRDINEDELNFLLSIVKGFQPRDQFEAMLAAQMAAIHMTLMTFVRQLRRVETIPQQDSAERALNKLARTFTTQLEALKRYRTGGEQKVTVQHVSVREGGQAIVGNVTTTPPQKKSEPKAIASSQEKPMPEVHEQNPDAVGVSAQKDDK